MGLERGEGVACRFSSFGNVDDLDGGRGFDSELPMLSGRLVGVVDVDVVDRFLLLGDAEAVAFVIDVGAAAEDEGVTGAALRAELGRPCPTSLLLRLGSLFGVELEPALGESCDWDCPIVRLQPPL